MAVNVAVLPGWANGKWHTKKFEAALTAAGYQISDSLHSEVIIAHSYACAKLQVKNPASLLILIDPPYWPGKPALQRRQEKAKLEQGSKPPQGMSYKIKNGLLSAVAMASKVQYASNVFNSHNELKFLEKLKTKSIYLVRNKNDYLCSPDIQVAVAKYPNIRFVEFPGIHDDYLYNPQPYIVLLPKA